MDEASPLSEPRRDGPGGDRSSPPGAPRWVKVFGIIAAVVLLVFVVLLVTGNRHGPGRHLDGGNERPAGVEHGTQHR